MKDIILKTSQLYLVEHPERVRSALHETCRTEQSYLQKGDVFENVISIELWEDFVLEI